MPKLHAGLQQSQCSYTYFQEASCLSTGRTCPYFAAVCLEACIPCRSSSRAKDDEPPDRATRTLSPGSTRHLVRIVCLTVRLKLNSKHSKHKGSCCFARTCTEAMYHRMYRQRMAYYITTC